MKSTKKKNQIKLEINGLPYDLTDILPNRAQGLLILIAVEVIGLCEKFLTVQRAARQLKKRLSRKLRRR